MGGPPRLEAVVRAPLLPLRHCRHFLRLCLRLCLCLRPRFRRCRLHGRPLHLLIQYQFLLLLQQRRHQIRTLAATAVSAAVSAVASAAAVCSRY